jgi:hypothetical protein
LITEPSASANVLMDRLAATVPDAYASKAQLRMLQCRAKAWCIERAKELVLGGLQESADMQKTAAEDLEAEGSRALRARQAMK